VRTAALIAILSALTGCGLLEPAGGRPVPAPPIAEARALLDDVVDAAIARDFDRMCSLASGTCESELDGVADRAPTTPPVVVGVSVHQPVAAGGGWTAGGVLFVLCGRDGAGDPYESEVLVSDSGRDGLYATAAVFWTGAGIAFADPGGGAVVGGEPTPGLDRCS
jgi:hypothetical protein